MTKKKMFTEDVETREQNLIDIKGRLFEYLEEKDIKDSEFARSIGATRQNVSLWRNNKADISPKTIVKIFNTHKDLNINWLFWGKGMPMLKEGMDKEIETILLSKTQEYGRKIKLLEIEIEQYKNLVEKLMRENAKKNNESKII